MFLIREVFFTPLCSPVHIVKISVKHFGRSMQEFFSRLQNVPFHDLFAILLDSPPPPPSSLLFLIVHGH